MKKDDDDDTADIVDVAGLLSIEPVLADAAKGSGQEFIAQIKTGADLFDQVNARAVDWAASHSAELVTGVTEATRNEIRDTISQGLEENIGTDGIADRLASLYAFSDERADLIAQTEVANANMAGALEGMRAARNAGVNLTKEWLPDADACDICLDNADAGPIPLDELFPSGDDQPQAHPNCKCSLISHIEDDDGNETETEDDEE